MKAELTDARVVRLNVPEWYARPDFVAAIERWDTPAATWHRPGRPVGEYSDVFCTYDHGEGDHADFFPEDIWASVCAEMERLGVEYAIVWMSNLAE